MYGDVSATRLELHIPPGILSTVLHCIPVNKQISQAVRIVYDTTRNKPIKVKFPKNRLEKRRTDTA